MREEKSEIQGSILQKPYPDSQHHLVQKSSAQKDRARITGNGNLPKRGTVANNSAMDKSNETIKVAHNILDELGIPDVSQSEREKSTPKPAVKKEDPPPVPAASASGAVPILPYPPRDYKPDPNEWKPYETWSDYQPPQKGNVTYNLWQLGPHRVLVRCGVHCVSFKDSPASLIHLMPKLERQPFLGYEQLSMSETARAWISAAIRGPNCKVLRARVNAINSEVTKVEEVAPPQIVPPGCAFNPQAAVCTVSSVFSKLQSLQPGNYLLGHAPGNSHLHIKKTTASTVGVYDLYQAYSKVNCEAKVEWRPLDPCLPRNLDIQMGRLPCTFHPKDKPNKVPMKKKSKKKGKQQS